MIADAMRPVPPLWSPGKALHAIRQYRRLARERVVPLKRDLIRFYQRQLLAWRRWRRDRAR